MCPVWDGCAIWRMASCLVSTTIEFVVMVFALQVTFEGDVILSQANEYEVLQLLLGECKTRLGNYAGGPPPLLLSKSLRP